jgi:hypothetical protein
VFHIPLFSNPKIESKGKVLHLKKCISAGIIKIIDIAFECRKVFLKEKYIVKMISEVFPDFSEMKIIKGVNKIFESLPEEWLNIVKENENTHKDKVGVFNPISKRDDKLSGMPNTTNRYYELFL